jgi:competence CoiA-like predicted nuclease
LTFLASFRKSRYLFFGKNEEISCVFGGKIMQRWGLKDDGSLVSVDEAEVKNDYLCPECHEVLRVKKGHVRAIHFFHVKEHGECRLRKRSTLHQEIQEYLHEILQDCTVECPFREIGRVADVAYHPLKVVFEIQISPISPEEALGRVRDYWSVGWHVIWLLHVDYYGKKQTKPVEEALQGVPHYFLDVGYRGGSIFDELSFVVKGRRIWKSFQRRKLNPRDIMILQEPQSKKPWQGQCDARKHWSCRIEGDFFNKDEVWVEKRKRNLFMRPKLFFKLLWARLLWKVS